MGPFWRAVWLAAWTAAAASCSSGSPTTEHVVDLSWAPNRERGVNQEGGGYRVEINGRSVIDVPYVSGPLAPTSVSTTLTTGLHVVTVRAYAALDAQGGTTGTLSAPSTLVIGVP